MSVCGMTQGGDGVLQLRNIISTLRRHSLHHNGIVKTIDTDALDQIRLNLKKID